MLLQFLEVAMNIDPQEKMIRGERIEKYILRKAFDTSDEPDVQPYLPDSILWRQKEQFSDGVGYGWIDALKDTAEKMVTDEMFKNPKPEWGDDIPDTKEAYVDQLKRTECLMLTLPSQVLVPPHVRRALPAVVRFDRQSLDAQVVQADRPQRQVSVALPLGFRAAREAYVANRCCSELSRSTRPSMRMPESGGGNDLFCI